MVTVKSVLIRIKPYPACLKFFLQDTNYPVVYLQKYKFCKQTRSLDID